jgi:hypothetical protein
MQCATQQQPRNARQPPNVQQAKQSNSKQQNQNSTSTSQHSFIHHSHAARGGASHTIVWQVAVARLSSLQAGDEARHVRTLHEYAATDQCASRRDAQRNVTEKQQVHTARHATTQYAQLIGDALIEVG